MLLIYPPPVWSASTTRQTFDDIQKFGSGYWTCQQTVCKNKGEAASRLAAENQQQKAESGQTDNVSFHQLEQKFLLAH